MTPQKDKVEAAALALIEALNIPIDHNTQDTPRRIAKLYTKEVFRGLYEPEPEITAFPNINGMDEMYVVKNITIRSTCAHHFAPIIGNAYIGVIPTDSLIGLSKFHRLCDWIASRPQIQEEMTIQIADKLEEIIKPLGLAVVIKAKHLCCSWRGVRDDSEMVTSIMRGALRDDSKARMEFLELIK